MADSLADVDLEWRIDLARKGDGELLAELLRRNEPIPPKLREFLIGVFAGEIKLKRPLLRTRTYMARSRLWLREKSVMQIVEIEMRKHGKQRDKNLRTQLIRKWCEVYGTSPAEVDRFRKHKPLPLTAAGRAQRDRGIARARAQRAAAKLRKSAQK
jgi:hypothetical protein